MPTNVIMPVLGMSQDKGRVVHWLKAEGEKVRAGEMLLEIETDKAVAEIESPADGILSRILTQEGEEVPVTQVIAVIISEDEASRQPSATIKSEPVTQPVKVPSTPEARPVVPSPLAARIAAEHNIDLQEIKPDGGRIQKSDVLNYLSTIKTVKETAGFEARLKASPKARRLAAEHRIDLAQITGSGPEGAVLADDVLTAAAGLSPAVPSIPEDKPVTPNVLLQEYATPGTIWRLMAEHTTKTWTTTPHFYLQRNVNASRLLAWHKLVNENTAEKITITDLLVFIVARSLIKHPRLNTVWQDGRIGLTGEINIGLATAVEDGLVVPVIHRADQLTLSEIAARRKEIVSRAQSEKLRPDDISGGTFTISNLGMYSVDTFLPIINSPQAAILAVGRIAEQVVPVNGSVGIQPMMNLVGAFDHRAVDGARGAQFLKTLAEIIEEPIILLK